MFKKKRSGKSWREKFSFLGRAKKMRHNESLIPKTIRELREQIVYTGIASKADHVPESYMPDFDGSYYLVERGIENMRGRLGDTRSDQLLEMIKQAKSHYDADNKLCSRLLQDVASVVVDRPVHAYPKRLYRWPRPFEEQNPASEPISPAHKKLFDKLCQLQEDHFEWPDRDLSSNRDQLLNYIPTLHDELGETLSNQLFDMMLQVNAHYDDGSPVSGDGLMQDIRRILCGLPVPFSSSEKEYRWPKSWKTLH